MFWDRALVQALLTLCSHFYTMLQVISILKISFRSISKIRTFQTGKWKFKYFYFEAPFSIIRVLHYLKLLRIQGLIVFDLKFLLVLGINPILFELTFILVLFQSKFVKFFGVLIYFHLILWWIDQSIFNILNLKFWTSQFIHFAIFPSRLLITAVSFIIEVLRSVTHFSQ